ncbi:HAMP domain-containing sensor histidine kinase [Caenimonas sp. SL110]|uniref:sensor histidine kinase n=1 Tax=Caenimonas sp. SL110 TaxID=1450524 RepID=UPI00069D1953|nr:HAMP domain-containing sensor histidine kinase [Caenimonas sp. SL110]
MTRPLPTLQGELSRTLTLVSVGWLLAIVLVVVWGVQHEVQELMDDALRESAEVVYGMISVHALLPDEAQDGVLPAPPHVEHMIWQVVGAQGLVMRRSHMAPSTPLMPVFVPGLSDTPDGWRAYAMALPEPQQVLYVAQTRSERAESRYEAAIFVALSALGVSLLFILVMRNRVEAGLRPLRDLTRQIKTYDPLLAATALPESTRAETADVRAATRDLGARLARRVLNEQAFGAHAAHALRTPLAGMDAQLALAQREVGDDARPRIVKARAEVQRLKRVVASLLALFRTGTELELAPVLLSDLAARLPMDDIDLQVRGSGLLRADVGLLSAALANLLDNSVRHGARTAWLSLQAEGRVQCLILQDDGPGVSDERRAVLQASLAEMDGESQSGLGLKLAHLVAQAHHGSLRLEPAPQGTHGFVVAFRLWEREEPKGGSVGSP